MHQYRIMHAKAEFPHHRSDAGRILHDDKPGTKEGDVVGIRAFDMFCGAGGSSYGARAAGAEIVGALDIWPLATATFSENFPHARMYTDAAEAVDPRRVAEDLGRIDLLLASPECTSHSVARGSQPQSEDSRLTAMQVVRYAAELGPRWIIVENVARMKSWPRYREFLLGLESLGYQVREQSLDSAAFQVPQRRRRLYVTASRDAQPPPIDPGPRDVAPTARSVLDPPGTWNARELYRPGIAQATIERAERAIAALGKSQEFLIVYYGSDAAGGWQDLDRPLRTITTLDRFGLVTPSKRGPLLRMLQVPELARAMGYGPDFRLVKGSRRDRIKLVGNGVCPPVMQAIVRTVTSQRIQVPAQSPLDLRGESDRDGIVPAG